MYILNIDFHTSISLEVQFLTMFLETLIVARSKERKIEPVFAAIS